MNHRKTSLFIFIALLLSLGGMAQPVRIEMGTVMNAAGQPISDGLMVYGSENLQKQISYSDVKGSPFMDTAFRWVKVYDAQNKLMATVQGKINFYNFNLHYLNENGAELAVSPVDAKRLEFIDPYDTGKILAEYYSGQPAINQVQKGPVFVSVLNRGEYQLMKFSSKYLTTYDSLMGNFKRYMFSQRTEYYLVKNNAAEGMRKLSKERVLAFTRNEQELQEFAKKNKLDFKKEEDVVQMLNYLNSTK